MTNLQSHNKKMTTKLPIAIISPHGGLAIPDELNGRIALTPEQIFNEADAYIDDIFNFADDVLYYETFPYARCILDMNRPANSALHHRQGDGVVKRITSYGDPVYHPRLEPDEQFEQYLINQHWQLWHDKLNVIANDPRIKLVIDCHSMASEGPATYDDPGNLRPRVSVSNMGDIYGNVYPPRGRISASAELTTTLAESIGDRLSDIAALTEVGVYTAVNTPFWGGWDVWQHGGYQQPWLMIEVNRGLYVGQQTAVSPIVPPDPIKITALRQRIWDAILDIVHLL